VGGTRIHNFGTGQFIASSLFTSLVSVDSMSNPRQKHFSCLFVFLFLLTIILFRSSDAPTEEIAGSGAPLPPGNCRNSKQGRTKVIDDTGIIVFLFLF
jgi:hypothetical protein